MRKSEIFDAYLSDSLTEEQAEKLKEILKTDDGSKEFMQYITETQVMCEILETKKEQAKETPKKAKNPVIPFFIAAAVAAGIAIFILLKTPVEPQTGTTVTKKGVDDGGSIKTEKVFKSHEIKNLLLTDGTRVSSSGNGFMTVFNEDKVKISNGKFTFQVKSRKGQTPFSIDMTHGKIQVIGTAFDILDTADRSSIRVTEGIVKLIKGDQELLLQAGDSAHADSGGLQKSIIATDKGLELFIDGKYTQDKAAFQDISGKNRTGWASWTPGDEGAVKQVIDGGNEAIAFTKSGRIGIKTFEIDGPLTLSAWVKPTGKITANQAIISNGSSSWCLSMNENTLTPKFSINGKDAVIADSPLIAGNWRLVSAVYNGKLIKIYIDGVLVNSTETRQPVGKYAGTIELAGNNESWYRNFEGRLDDMRIYSRALNDLEILKLFQDGRP